ncbi:MAG: hypothetical protein WAR80_10695, partial [Ferruginibacter sp.]
MKKYYLLCMMLFAAYINSGFAQTVSSQKGLTTTVFNLPAGTIKVYLPDDIRPGDMISGSVLAAPFGKNTKQTAKNLAELKKFAVEFNGQKIQVANVKTPVQYNINASSAAQLPLILIDETGNTAAQLNIPCATNNQTQTPNGIDCKIPTHAITAAPLRIKGSFDGNSSNTNCTIGDQPATILAESPRQCIIQFPDNSNGMQNVQIQENGQQKCSQPVSSVNMELSAGKLNLMKGEKTHLNVKITGLHSLPDTALLTVINVTPTVVNMQPANQVVIALAPDSMEAGTFERRFDMVSVKTGGFTVNVNLELPDVMLTPFPGDKNDGKCGCSITADIANRSSKNPRGTYVALVKRSCSGKDCNEKSVTYKWEIVSGKENADILDKTHTKSIVTVQPKNAGTFILKLITILTCSDGSTCTAVKFINEKDEITSEPAVNVKTDTKAGDKPKITEVPDIPKNPVDSSDKFPKVCDRVVNVISEPKLDGKLKSYQIGLSNTAYMQRDEYIALEAAGADWDMLIFECNPKEPDCKDTRSIKKIPLVGRVRYEWKIEGDNNGSFVTLGCLNDSSTAKGEHVIFKPPFVPMPDKTNETTVTTKITLSIIDDGSAADDGKVDKTITIKTKRVKTSPDKYQIDISGGTGTIPTAPKQEIDPGSCSANGPDWILSDNLIEPTVILPEKVEDNNKMVLGQWIVLSTPDQRDSDDAAFVCVSTGGCATQPKIIKSFPDKVEYNWEITKGGGKFITGNTGRYVIYQAPVYMSDEDEVIEVKFKVTASNYYKEKPKNTKSEDIKADDITNRKDKDKMLEVQSVLVYRPGIKLSLPKFTWLPADNNDTSFISELMYKESGEWKPALAHMSRIHFFQLMNVSNETGVCMNYPIPKNADKCPDLKFKQEGKHEAFDAAPGTKCKNIFLQARTERPEKVYTIKVYSLDFGAFGLLRSFANLSNGGENPLSGESPVYVSIPIKESDVQHPDGRKKREIYKDNRVNIPYDIDENRIADNGWTSSDGKRMKDPVDLIADDDELPTGDGFAGDGLSNYEEYRGFKTVMDKKIVHIRTNYEVKDILIMNRNILEDKLKLYKDVSELNVSMIN